MELYGNSLLAKLFNGCVSLPSEDHAVTEESSSSGLFCGLLLVLAFLSYSPGHGSNKNIVINTRSRSQPEEE